MRLTKFTFPFIIISFACCAGCGQQGGTVPVEGIITLDGEPLPDIQVLFDQPDLGPSENKGYTGRTDEEGRYILVPVTGEGSGVPPGTYRVSLSTAGNPSAPAPPPGANRSTIFYPESLPPPPERVPPAYRGGKLSFTVTEDGTDQANFDLKSR
jgi:hypothetical protein